MSIPKYKVLITLVVVTLSAIAIYYLLQHENRGNSPFGINGNNTVPDQNPGNNSQNEVPVPLRSENIIVSLPYRNSEVGLPLVVRGEARTFENVVNVRLSQQDGRILAEDFTTADAPDIGQFGPFEFQLTYPEPTQRNGILEVFQHSAKDGSEIDKVTIPVIFARADAMMINVYFSGQNSQNCEAVVSARRRIPRTQQTARAALEQLLRGPTAEERNQGLQTQINPGVEIKGLSIQNGVAYADFNDALENGVAGSCRVQAIRSQITQTLLQFPTINSVQISINGRTNDVLQP